MFTGCPYCLENSFECEAIPANEAATDNSARHGDWFNQCALCGKWSKFDERTGEQVKLSNPGTKPK